MAEQSRAEQSRAEQSRAEQSRAEQSRAEQSRAEQSQSCVRSSLMSGLAWLRGLRRTSSRSESSSSRRYFPSRRPASANRFPSFSSPVRRRGLLPALFSLSLLTAFSLSAAAQTVDVPATQTVTESATDSRVSMTFTGDPGTGNDDTGNPTIVSGGTASGRQSHTDISCTAGDDFVVKRGTDNAVFVVAGQSTHTSNTFTVCADTVDEPTETFTIRWHLGAATDTFDGNASHCHSLGSSCDTTFTLIDDDPTVVSIFRTGNASLTEGDKIEFEVNLDSRALVAGEIIDVPLSIISAGGVLTTGDFSLAKKSGMSLNTGVTLSGETTLNPKVRFSGVGAQTATLELTATDDGVVESSGETWHINLGTNSAFDAETGTNVGGGADPEGTDNTFAVTVNDPPQALTLTVAPSSAAEGNTASRDVNVTVAKPAGSAQVSYSLCFSGSATLDENGTQAASEDYQVINSDGTTVQTIFGSGANAGCVGIFGESTFASNEDSETWKIRVFGDTDVESDETVIVTLKEYAGTPLPADFEISSTGNPATHTIEDDDTVDITIANVDNSVEEGDPAVFTITANRAVTANRTILLTVADEGSQDYVAPGDEGDKTVTINAGATTASYSVPTVDDTIFEGNGQVSLTVRADPANYHLPANPTVAYVTVTENETAPAFSTADFLALTAKSTSLEAHESDRPNLHFKVDRIKNGGQDYLTGTWGFQLCFTGTATRGADYTVSAWNGLPLTIGADGCTGAGGLPAERTFMQNASHLKTARSDFYIGYVDDGHEDSGETIIVTLQNPIGDGRLFGDGDVSYGKDQLTFTILNSEGGTTHNPVPGSCVSPELQSDVEGYAKENYGDAHVQRWKKVLKAFAREPGGMTATEARQMEAKYSANRWKPVAEAIECLETEAQTIPDPVPVTDDTDTTAPNSYADLIERMIEWRNDPKWKNHKTHTDRWDRALLAFGESVSDPTLTPMTANEAQGYADKGMTRWIEVAQALAEIESRDQTDTQTDTTPPDPVPVILPELSLSSGSGIDEGGNAEFTITSTPAPSSDLEITFSVTQSGDYLTAPEPTSRTITLPAGSTSTTLSFATVNDDTDEADGSVQVTIEAGTDYTIAPGQQSGTVIVQDNDEPVVSVTAGDSVPEGDPATFTVSASPTPASPLTVTLSITQSGEVAVSGQTGDQEIIIPINGSVTVEIPTDDDSTDEADGSISATVLAKDGYTVAASPDDTATVTVTDNDEVLTVSIPSLSVEDAEAHENEGRLSFTVRLNPPSKTKVTVWAWLRESDPVSAQEGIDYRSWNAWDATRLIFPAGTTERTLAVPIINDSHDEEAETFEIRLSNATGGALIEKQTGLMTIVNSDPMPAAWLSRFGRTVAQQALDGIATRISAPRNAGTQGALAGQTLNANDSVGRSDSSDSSDTWTPFTRPSVNIADSLTDSFAHPHGFSESRTMTGLDALLGSHFTVTEETGISGESLSYWGRAAQSSFDGQEGTFSLDGEATTAMLGMDYARNQWMAGFALMKSDADGNYTDTKVTPRPDTQDCPGMEPICMNAVREGDGQIEASLTSLIPYTAIQTSPNMKWWGAFGYGTGETTLKPEPGGSYSSDISWNMAALGMRADLIQPDNGPALALTSDALWTNTESDQTQDLAASDSNTTRLRMGLEGNWKTETKDGGQFTPKIEVGVRHDGGDAETGLGLEVGAGLIWTNPNTGLHLDLSGRTLMTHDSDDLKDQGFAAALAFDPQPQSERGLSFSIRQEIGGAAQGGLDALFQESPLSDRTSNPQSRWTTRAQYGYPAGNGDWTATPQISLGMSTDTRELQLGWSVTPITNQPDWSFTVQTTRREQESQNPTQSVGVGWRVRW